MEVLSVTRSRNVEGRFYVKLSDETTVTADINMIADFSLYEGRKLSEDEVTRLMAAEERSRAKERALHLLSNRQMSRRELIGKLTAKGDSAEAAENAADIMERVGALNDGEYARTVVRHYSKKGYGMGRIKQELSRRGINRELWDDALSELPEGTDTLDSLINKKLKGKAPDKKELKRLTVMLVRRGFSWSDIRTALGKYDEMLEMTEE